MARRPSLLYILVEVVPSMNSPALKPRLLPHDETHAVTSSGTTVAAKGNDDRRPTAEEQYAAKAAGRTNEDWYVDRRSSVIVQSPPGTAAGAPTRSRMWSLTRSALAMMVSAGLTAPLEGKKLPSTIAP